MGIEQKQTGSRSKKICKKRISLPEDKTSLPGKYPPKFSRKFFPGEDSLCDSRRKASLTVEAALALPLFFLVFVSLVSLLRIYGSYVETAYQLKDQAEAAGLYAAAGSSVGSLVGLTGNDAGEQVENLFGIDASEPWIVLTDTVSCELPFLPFDAETLKIPVRSRVRAWVGREYGSADAEEAEQDTLVYVTENKSVYHTSSACSYLSLSIQVVSGSRVSSCRNSSGSRYQACPFCVGNGDVAQAVYITEYGEVYHNRSDCSALTRHISMVSLEDVSGLHECSKCAALRSET